MSDFLCLKLMIKKIWNRISISSLLFLYRLLFLYSIDIHRGKYFEEIVLAFSLIIVLCDIVI